MAGVTLSSVADRFPVGTSVAAYKASDFPAGWSGGALPAGISSVATATVASDGSLVFSGLTQGVAYKAYASVSGANVYVSFSAKDTTGANANAPGGTQLVESSSTAKGYQQLTSTAAAATIASLCTGGTLPTGATKVLLVPSAQVRVRDDGTNPSATVGYPIPASTEWRYDADQLAALKVYGAATIDAYFYA